MPSFLDVPDTVTEELVESMIVAEEMDDKNKPLAAEIRSRYSEGCMKKIHTKPSRNCVESEVHHPHR